MRRLVVIGLMLITTMLAYIGLVQFQRRADSGFANESAPVRLPSKLRPLAAQANLIRPLHEKKKPNQPGDWLERFPEGGQTFAQYVQVRGGKPLRDKFTTIYIQPLGEFDQTQERIAEQTAKFMEHFFGMSVQSLGARPLGDVPAKARRMRNDVEQVLTTWILDDVLKPKRPDDAVAVIGLVTCDLWPGNLNWVFGQASMSDRVGVWSLHRNGDPHPSGEAYRLCLRRTLKTAVHETGHMLGIPHCAAYECCMNGSRSREESDRQPLEFCPECQPKIWWTCGADPVRRCQMLERFANESELAKEAAVWNRQINVLSAGPKSSR